MSTSAMRVQALNGDDARRLRNGATGAVKSAVTEALDGALTAMIDVSLAARQAHWNVRGAGFYPLHELFGRIQKELDLQVDELAERMAAVGGIPCGTVQAVARGTNLPAYPLLGESEEEHLSALASRLSSVGATLRGAHTECERNGDAISAHHVIEAWACVDKLRWLVESQLKR